MYSLIPPQSAETQSNQIGDDRFVQCHKKIIFVMEILGLLLKLAVTMFFNLLIPESFSLSDDIVTVVEYWTNESDVHTVTF